MFRKKSFVRPMFSAKSVQSTNATTQIRPSSAPRTVESIAIAAKNYARREIFRGCTQLENNQLDRVHFALHYVGIGLKHYFFDLMTENMVQNGLDYIKPQHIYMRKIKNGVQYTLLDPYGNKIMKTIPAELLRIILSKEQLNVLNQMDFSDPYANSDADSVREKQIIIDSLSRIIFKQNKKLDDSVGIRDEVKKRVAADIMSPSATVAEFESCVAVTSKYLVGNCWEYAIQALDYILTHCKEDIRAEIFEIAGRGGDHAFLVLNRKPGSNSADPMTWGNDAYICDPWSNKVYKATEYDGQLKDFFQSNGQNFVTDFRYEAPTATVVTPDIALDMILKNENRHVEPQVKVLRPHGGFNTTYLKDERTFEKLLSVFNNHIESLKAILNTYIASLQLEKEQLETKYGENDAKVSIIWNKLKNLEGLKTRLVIVAHNTALKVRACPVDEQQAKYRDVKAVLANVVHAETQALIKDMQFSKPDVSILVAHRHWSPFRTSDDKSTTHQHLEAINNALNDALPKYGRAL